MSFYPACINLENGLMVVAMIVGPWWVATDNRVQKKNIVVPRWLGGLFSSVPPDSGVWIMLASRFSRKTKTVPQQISLEVS